MIIKILLTVIFSCLSGLFYRFGGMDKPFKSWMRDWVVPIFSLGTLFILWQPNIWWGYLLSIPVYVLMALALSTYWDWLFNEDNFFIHGFFVGVSFFPFCFVGLHWYAVLINAVISGLLMWWLCIRTGNVFKEEFGRGFIAAIIRVLLVL